MSTTEVARRKSKQGAQGEADRRNESAFPGQKFNVQRLNARSFAVVMTDTGAADNRPMLSGKGRVRETFTERDFYALAGKRSHSRMRGTYATIR